MLNVPFASTVPSAPSATAYGLPGTSAAAHAPASRTSSNVRRTTCGCSAKRFDRRGQRAAHPAALRREHGEGGAARTGRFVEPVRERARRVELRPLAGDLQRALRAQREPQLAELARQRERRDRQRDEAEQRHGEPDRQPALGARLRARQQRQERERRRRAARCGRSRRAPDAPAGAEASARSAAAPAGEHRGLRDRHRGEQRGAGPSRRLDPGDDARRDRSSAAISPPHASAAARPWSP